MDEDRIKSLEDHVEKLGQKIEELGQKAGDKIEEGVRRVTIHRHHREPRGTFWGLALILIGVVWLGNKVGWFDMDIPFWPSALILLGLYVIWDSRK